MPHADTTPDRMTNEVISPEEDNLQNVGGLTPQAWRRETNDQPTRDGS